MADRNGHVEITVPIDFCSLLPCRNDGRCQNTGSSYICHCPSNFRGPHCEHYVDDRTLNVNWVTTAPQPRETTTANSLSAPGTAALGSLLALVVLTLIFVVCCLWRSKTRHLPQSTSGRPANGRTNTMPSLSSFNSISERVSYTVHRDTSVDSRVDGGSVNHGYDPDRDLPPPYLSVVGEPKFIIDVDNCQELPPSYNDVVAAESDVYATSGASEVTTSQNEHRNSEDNVTSMQDRHTASLDVEDTSVQEGEVTSVHGETTCVDVDISPV